MQHLLQRLGKFISALLAGVIVSLCFLGIAHLVEDVHPLDQTYYLTLFVGIGASVGGVIGLFWSTAGVGRRRPIVIGICWAGVGAAIFAVPMVFDTMPLLLVIPTVPGWLTCSLLADATRGALGESVIVIIGTVVQSAAYGIAGVVVSRFTAVDDEPIDDRPMTNRLT